ncbi:MAG: integral rane, YjbE family protein [Thermoleophilia bacterium]|nr:integral rane, YjbE family protein [Thermoleophilia bacterium]
MLPDFGAEFFVALGGIIVADLVLAGDNAVVIALAARNLPKELRRRAVFIGAVAAIALRASLTVAAVFLLKQDLPFVQLIGGVALLWIAWNLAIEEQHDHEGIDTATTMRGAIRTILVADVVMSIDNVLAVAAFAKDDIWLVVIGLLISIPIVMGGASILLRLIDRYPIIVWIGAALIGYVGVELIFIDPVVHHRLPEWLAGIWTERLVAVAIGIAITSVAWYVRTHDRDGTPPTSGKVSGEDPDGTESGLMVEGSDSDG